MQLGLAVDPVIIFPPEYPYTSGTTKLLRDNFAELYSEVVEDAQAARRDTRGRYRLQRRHANCTNFRSGGHRVLGIEPTDVVEDRQRARHPDTAALFSARGCAEVRREHGPAQVVTAANCFAHIEDVHAIVEGILAMLAPDGVFISESHYVIGLMDRLQYDTVYHEHLRYYSLGSLANLLRMHGLEVFHARPYSHPRRLDQGLCRAKRHAAGERAALRQMLAAEPRGEAMRSAPRCLPQGGDALEAAAPRHDPRLKESGARIVGISAPSRASTLVNYVGLDEAIIDYVCEIPGSLKIGKSMPGTAIPVVEESDLFDDQPDCAIIFSWHIADELAPKLRAKGFRGKLISPLPVPREI